MDPIATVQEKLHMNEIYLQSLSSSVFKFTNEPYKQKHVQFN